MTTAADFVRALLYTSHKAADLARAVRTEHELFELLVQEKGGREKNSRFVHDFKTLADVLIQETIRHDLTRKFPDLLSADIHGEESNKFTNALGESVVVEVKSTPAETAATLSLVLDKNVVAAELLAGVVHGGDDQYELAMSDCDDSLAQLNQMNLTLNNLGIWIDPIDSTAEYINGKDEDVDDGVICVYGLLCVTILIGVYDKITGDAVMGVINQPFHRIDKETRRWTGRNFWGLAYEGQLHNSLSTVDGATTPDILKVAADDLDDCVGISARKRILLSGSEETATRGALERAGHHVSCAAGAGYKLLCVATSEADAYLLSRPTTFYWDSCAPHALLRSMGGGVVDFSRTTASAASELLALPVDDIEFGKKVARLQLRYHRENDGSRGSRRWCNLGGVVAYRDKRVLRELVRAIAEQRADSNG